MHVLLCSMFNNMSPMQGGGGGSSSDMFTFTCIRLVTNTTSDGGVSPCFGCYLCVICQPIFVTDREMQLHGFIFSFSDYLGILQKRNIRINQTL